MKRIEIGYTASFLRQFKKLTPPVQEAAHEAIEDFADPRNHPRLKAHKLLSFAYQTNNSVIPHLMRNPAKYNWIPAFAGMTNVKQLMRRSIKGRLKGSYSFSIDYRLRIVFDYIASDVAILHAIGDHEVYQ